MDPLLRGPFQFNLLPPKSKQVLALEIERDDSILYSMILVFVAGLAFFGVTMANTLLVEPRVLEFEASIDNRKEQISLFEEVRNSNGELFVKTRTLAPVLERRIETNEIFRVADRIDSTGSVEVISYGRERTGLFVFQVKTSTLLEVAGLVESVKKIDGISEVLFRNSRFREVQSDYLTTIALNINVV